MAPPPTTGRTACLGHVNNFDDDDDDDDGMMLLLLLLLRNVSGQH